MTYSLLTQDEKDEIVKLFVDAGFEFHPVTDPDLIGIMTGLFFTIPLTDEDRNNAILYHKPNHFAPNTWRSVSVFSNYITSDIRGTWRIYRGRRITSRDTANIFSFIKGKNNPVENAKKWLTMYAKLEYNRNGMGV